MGENAVALKLPTFWADQVQTWFAQAEAQFLLRGITQDETKFAHVVAVLDSQTAMQAAPVIHDPPATEKYRTLKDFLTQTFSLSEAERAERLLSMDELGDRKPSQLMSTIIHLYGPKPHNFLLKHIFLRALPEKLRNALASCKEEDLRELAKEADRLMPLVERQVCQTTDPGIDAVQQRQQKRGLCFFHFRFGAKARNCQPPCTWKPGKGYASSQ
mgnify:CR=1 FL=1